MPSSRAGVFVNLEPFVGAVLGITVLREPLSPGTLAGGLLIIAAAFLTTIAPAEERSTVPPPTTGEPAPLPEPVSEAM